MFINLDDFLDYAPTFGTLLTTLVIAFISLESGFRFGRRQRDLGYGEPEMLIRTMVGAMVA